VVVARLGRGVARGDRRVLTALAVLVVVTTFSVPLAVVHSAGGPPSGPWPSLRGHPSLGTTTASGHPPSSIAGPHTLLHPGTATPPSWVNVSRKGAGAPPPVYGESVAYDPVANETILFGGCYIAQCPGNETWAFSNGGWTNLTPRSGSPPAREDASMDFDANMGGLLLFGGNSASGTALNDTWLFRGGRWTNLTYIGPAPTARWGAALAFDPDPEANGSVLYGGCGIGGCAFNDTWAWEGGAGWVHLTLTDPGPSLGWAAMAFDVHDDYLVLFGGCSGFLCLGESNQTWEFYGGQWWQKAPAVHPSARVGAGMVYDPVSQEVMLFGGTNLSSYFSDTWSFAGGAWQELAPSTSPSARTFFGLTLDPSGTSPLLVGGIGSGPAENDTWVYVVPEAVTFTPSTTTSETSQSVDFTASVTGGVAPYELSIAFGDGARATASGSGPTFSLAHRYGFAGTFVASANVTDSDGLVASASTLSIDVTVGPTVTANATPSDGDVGLPFSFHAAASAGSSPFVYGWSFGDGATGTGASPSHTYISAGTYRVRVNLTDGLGGTANDTFSVTVSPVPAVTLSFSPTAPNNTTPVAWHATVTGGTAPFTFAWQFGDGTESAIPSPTHTFGRTGAYTVKLWVNDSVGASASDSQSITVSPAKSSSPPPSNNSTTTIVHTTNVTASAPTWFWPGVVGLVAVAGVGSFVLLRWGRARTVGR